MINTTLCDELGIELPIIQAPLGPDLSGAALAAAVSDAGALGTLQAQLHPPAAFRAELQQIRRRTPKPFAVNFILYFPCEDAVAICLDEGVPALSLFWGDPAPFVRRAHAAGTKVIHQVGSVEAARRAADAGVDIINAQGFEAGGHVEGRVTTLALVPQVVDAVAPTPVVAAGGIADGRGLLAVLALGASGAALGTRMLATEECRAHAHYKEQLLKAGEEDTEHTILFGHGWPHAPHRTLRTPFVEQWLGREAQAQESRPEEPVIGKVRIAGQEMPLQRFMGFPPNLDAMGDIGSMDMLAGQGVGRVASIEPAGAVVRRIAEEARDIAMTFAARF